MPSSAGMSKIRGFSLLEVLAVTALLAIAMGWAMPIWTGGLKQAHSHSQAIRLLMGVLEQARSAAVASGLETHVVFWKRIVPEINALLIVQTEDIPDAVAKPVREFLSGWIRLPQGCSLEWNLPGGDEFPETVAPSSLPLSPPEQELSMLSFGPYGNVIRPVSGPLKFRIGSGPDAGVTHDEVNVGRFSGRAVWEGVRIE